MITETQMYWVTRLDHVKYAVGSVSFTLGLIWFLALVAGIMLVCFGTFFGSGKYGVLESYGNDEANRLKRVMKKNGIRMIIVSGITLVLDVLLMCGDALLPTTKEMAAICVVPKIANSQTVHELGNGIVDLAREWIEELHPTKKPSKEP